VATISLGRPVLPPEVGAFHEPGTTEGSGSSASAASGSNPAGAAGRPGTSDGSTPTTSAGSASSRIARRSAAGSRAEMGWGVAPSFQAAMVASKNAMPLGSAIVTKLSGRTPRRA
jgi:hypothetical protein